jgi:hypothetical protein
MFGGSVHGVAGAFSCTGTMATCGTPVRQSDGTVNATRPGGATAEWHFMPTDPDAMVDTSIDDMYLTFGWWLDKGDGTVDFKVDSFAMAASGLTATEETVTADDLNGTATYEGAAAGKYVLLGVEADTAEGGHFTADAMLTVDFDGDIDDNNTQDIAVSGMIDGFMTGAMSRPGWAVTLGTLDGDPDSPGLDPIANLSHDTGGGNEDATGMAEWTTGGAVMPGTGTWQAEFYGGAGPGTVLATGPMFPTHVVGTFNAELGGADDTPGREVLGRISGAFGAMEE